MDKVDLPGRKSPAPVEDNGPVELRRRICDAVQRIAEVDGERYALEEVRDGLEAKERDLQRRLIATRDEVATMERELAARGQRSEELAAQIAAVRRDLTGLERESADAVLRARDLARETDRLAGELRRRRAGDEALEVELQSVCETVARMDRKLGCAERRRAAPASLGSRGDGAT